jgi:hypothetical protein
MQEVGTTIGEVAALISVYYMSENTVALVQFI